MFFKDYSLLVVFDAYLRSKCTTPDMHTCDGAGLVVIRSLRTALGLLKEERKKKERKNAKTAKICNCSLRVAILIFIVKQAVPATFIDFLQALTLEIPSEIVKMQ